jgi:hypothetical protein
MARETSAEKQARIAKKRSDARTRVAVRRAQASIGRAERRASRDQPPRSARGKITNKNTPPSAMSAQATRTPADRAMERQRALRRKIAKEAKGTVSTSPPRKTIQNTTRRNATAELNNFMKKATPVTTPRATAAPPKPRSKPTVPPAQATKSNVKKLKRNVPKDQQKTSLAAARKAGHLYYYKNGKKMAAVSAEMLKKSGFKSLRAYMNFQENKTAKK